MMVSLETGNVLIMTKKGSNEKRRLNKKRKNRKRKRKRDLRYKKRDK